MEENTFGLDMMAELETLDNVNTMARPNTMMDMELGEDMM